LSWIRSPQPYQNIKDGLQKCEPFFFSQCRAEKSGHSSREIRLYFPTHNILIHFYKIGYIRRDEKSESLVSVMDKINNKYSIGTIWLASEGTDETKDGRCRVTSRVLITQETGLSF
jgi:hypothetical protein